MGPEVPGFFRGSNRSRNAVAPLYDARRNSSMLERLTESEMGFLLPLQGRSALDHIYLHAQNEVSDPEQARQSTVEPTEHGPWVNPEPTPQRRDGSQRETEPQPKGLRRL
jgi:hypothetical protein